MDACWLLFHHDFPFQIIRGAHTYAESPPQPFHVCTYISSDPLHRSEILSQLLVLPAHSAQSRSGWLASWYISWKGEIMQSRHIRRLEMREVLGRGANERKRQPRNQKSILHARPNTHDNYYYKRTAEKQTKQTMYDTFLKEGAAYRGNRARYFNHWYWHMALVART